MCWKAQIKSCETAESRLIVAYTNLLNCGLKRDVSYVVGSGSVCVATPFIFLLLHLVSTPNHARFTPLRIHRTRTNIIYSSAFEELIVNPLKRVGWQQPQIDRQREWGQVCFAYVRLHRDNEQCGRDGVKRLKSMRNAKTNIAVRPSILSINHAHATIHTPI